MSRRDEIVSGLKEQNEKATFQGVTGYWCQGDAVIVDAPNAMMAISAYRLSLAEARIGINHNLFCGSIIATQRQIRIEELEDAIKEHRGQKLDDRCWMDDQKLYAALKDGNIGDNSTPPKEKMLENCARYIDKRCTPGAWKTYQQLEQENEELRSKLKEKEL